MAATAVVNPNTQMYSSGPPPPYSSWSTPDTASRLGLISTQDSRGASDNKAEPPSHIQTAPPPQRQSLPSIHEALGAGARSNSYKSPVSASFPQAQVPFSQPPSASRYLHSEQTTYPHTPPSHRQASPPHPTHLQPSSYTRPAPPQPEPSRHAPLTSLQASPGPPNPYTSRYESDSRLPEPAPNGYSHRLPQQNAYQYGPQPHQIPPTTPHEPAFNQPRYQAREGQNAGTSWKASSEQSDPIVFQKSLKRNFEGYDFENRLSQIGKSSNVLKDFSSHYIRIANEQQRSVNTVPDRMPDLAQCSEMLHHAQLTVDSLNRLKEMVYEQEQTMMADQRMREQGARPGGYDDEMSMYGEDMKSHGYGEGKKRRGRAAPPGRCHSCNRAETPEWRRGPDGARTLCNACGLHYAKLTRKNTMKQSQGSNGSSSLRPKSMDGSDTRPPPPLQ